MNNRQLMARLSVLVLPVVFGASLVLAQGQAKPEAVEAPAVFEYADQVTRLVQNQKIDELAKLTIPTVDPPTTKLQEWTSAYVSSIQKQEGERDKQYAAAVNEATDYLKQEKY